LLKTTVIKWLKKYHNLPIIETELVNHIADGKERMQTEIWFQKYRILGLLGCGATASVYLAEHIRLNSYRAIKFISKKNPLYELQRKEAFILKGLKHSCIPIIYDIEENEEGSYIVEQYIEGVTLKEYISKNGTLREDIAINAGIQLCDLILYLKSVERPIIYLDLKPENIMLSDMKLKLVDFGSAIFYDESSDNQRYMATRGYAAPELYRQGRIDERCEVYGIGMLLYYMVTGAVIDENLHHNINIDHRGSCSKRLRSIINNCIKYNPSQRYSGVDILYKHLSAIRKNQIHLFPDKSIRFAVAGSQSRIGVTHFSLRLCSYLKDIKYKVLYIERNNSGCVRAVRSRYYEEINDNDKGDFKLNGLTLQAYSREQPHFSEDYQAYIYDYGCLTERNITEFLAADIKLILLGAKDWELDESERVLAMTAGYKDIIYLFNYMNGKQFQTALKSMKNISCYRIPYEPDPFATITEGNGLDLFKEIAERTLKGIKSGRIAIRR
jgi:serine/threonine-protein kinase